MQNNRLLDFALAGAIAFCFFPGRAGAQEDKLVVNPPLSQDFPLELKPDGIRLKFPVLVNERTILGPNVVLRFIYVDPNAGQHPRGGASEGGQGDSGQGGHGHHHGGGSQDAGDGGSAFTRGASTQGADDGAAPLDAPGSNKDSSSEIRTEVWTEIDLFREALDQAADIGTTLVYSAPNKSKPQSTTIDLPDGMLLGETDGHVKVLGMTQDSEALQSGIQPEDEILSFEGNLPVTSLRDFLHTYFEVKEAARKSGKPYSVEIWRPGESKEMTIQMGAPPSLPTLF